MTNRSDFDWILKTECNFDRILKTKCNLQHFTRNCRIKNFDDFERDETDAQSRAFNCERERNDHTLPYEQVFGNIFERMESECCAVLMKYRRKTKGERTSDHSPNGSAIKKQKY